jgi:hypothetical protein
VGYKRSTRIIRLVFEDPEFDGLQVRAKVVPLGQLMSIAELAGATEEHGAGAMQSVRDLFAGFADALVSWNLEDDDDQPVPATYEGMLTQDFDFMMSVVQQWMTAVAGVAAPLGRGSSGGETALEASLPMAPLSTSPSS